MTGGREEYADGIGREDLDECWCCGGLHDSLGALCPSCDDAGCTHFGGECQSDHKPALPDGGQDPSPTLQIERHWIAVRGERIVTMADTRAGFSKVRELKRHVEVYPVHRLTRKERVEIILRSDCPRNPLWTEPKVIKDCGCLCNGDPSEKEKTKELFPAFGQRLDEWEEAITHDFPHDTLGWNGLTADEQAMERDGLEQATLTTCGIDVDCQTARDPAEVAAFEADAQGAPVEESVSILYYGAPQGAVA